MFHFNLTVDLSNPVEEVDPYALLEQYATWEKYLKGFRRMVDVSDRVYNACEIGGDEMDGIIRQLVQLGFAIEWSPEGFKLAPIGMDLDGYTAEDRTENDTSMED